MLWDEGVKSKGILRELKGNVVKMMKCFLKGITQFVAVVPKLF